MLKQFIRQNNLRQADVIVLKKKFFGMVDHFAVFLGYEHGTNRPLFAANYTAGTCFISHHELVGLLATLVPERIERFAGTEAQRILAIQRAMSKIGADDYNYFENNCEHYKNFVQTGVAHSPQAENFKNALTAGTVILLLGALLGQK